VREQALYRRWAAPAYADYLPLIRHPIAALRHARSARGRRQRAPCEGGGCVFLRDGGLVRSVLIRALQEIASSAKADARPRAAAARPVAAMSGRALPRRRELDCGIPPARPIGRRRLNHRARHFSAGVRASRAVGIRRRPPPPRRGAPPAELSEPAARPASRRRPRAELHALHRGQTREVIVIVDQHAAHERIVYDAAQKALAQPTPASPLQILLIPRSSSSMPPTSRGLVCPPPRSSPATGSRSSRSGPARLPCVDAALLRIVRRGGAGARDLADTWRNGTRRFRRAAAECISADTMAFYGAVRRGAASMARR